MADLSSAEKMKLEQLLGMGSGYVLDFSNNRFGEFMLDNAGIDIFSEKYAYGSGSKANRLRAYWKITDNLSVGKLILRLLEHWKLIKELNGQIITMSEKCIYEDCMRISERLIMGISNQSLRMSEIESIQKKDAETKKKEQLNLLLKMFDDLSVSNDQQRRGFLLQDLLYRLFLAHEFPVTKSFQRNMGGEQIDGAFTYKSWHYQVECKWTEKLADIRELDSLLGKVNRGGKQAMGLFISIEGWSKNVPPLLKQNPEKCIILMEGYDLRSVLNGAIDLEYLLDMKLASLNNDSEPFCSVVEILKS